MSIKLKLLLGCLCLTMVTIGLGAFALKSQRDLGVLAERIYDEALVSMSHLRSAQNTLLKQEAVYRVLARVGAASGGGALRPLLPPQPMAAILQDLQVASERAISPAGKDRTNEIRRRMILLAKAPATMPPGACWKNSARSTRSSTSRSRYSPATDTGSAER